MPKTFGKARKTVGKSFAEGYTRRTPLGEGRLGKAIFAECFLSSTRETLLLSAKLTLGKEFLKNKIKKTPTAAATALPACPPPPPMEEHRLRGLDR